MPHDVPDPAAERVQDLDPLLCFDIYAANQAFGRLYKAYLEPLGLTYAQYLVLLLLRPGQGMSVGQIGDALGLESNTLTPLLKRMQQAGLVTRNRDTRDERRVLVRLTETGAGVRAQAQDVPRRIATAIGLPPSDLKALQAQLRDLTRRLRAASSDRRAG